jgi:hypothetical protein
MASNDSIITIKKAKKAGIVDGKNGYPEATSTRISEFEVQLQTATDYDFNQYQDEWDKQLQEIEDHMLHNIENYDKDKKDYDTLYAKYEKTYKDIEIDTTAKKEQIKIWFILLMIVEVFVNATALRFTQEIGILNVFFAAIIAITMTYIGHWMGKVIKSRESHKKDIIIAIILGVFVMVGIIVLGLARTRGLAGEDMVSEDKLLSNILFILVNSLLFFFCFLNGYINYPKFPTLQNKYNNLQRRQRKAFDHMGAIKKNYNNFITKCKRNIHNAALYQSTYQLFNQRARAKTQNKIPPSYFGKSDTLTYTLPPEYQLYQNQYQTHTDPSRAWAQGKYLNQPQGTTMTKLGLL